MRKIIPIALAFSALLIAASVNNAFALSITTYSPSQLSGLLVAATTYDGSREWQLVVTSLGKAKLYVFNSTHQYVAEKLMTCSISNYGPPLVAVASNQVLFPCGNGFVNAWFNTTDNTILTTNNLSLGACATTSPSLYSMHRDSAGMIWVTCPFTDKIVEIDPIADRPGDTSISVVQSSPALTTNCQQPDSVWNNGASDLVIVHCQKTHNLVLYSNPGEVGTFTKLATYDSDQWTDISYSTASGTFVGQLVDIACSDPVQKCMVVPRGFDAFPTMFYYNTTDISYIALIGNSGIYSGVTASDTATANPTAYAVEYATDQIHIYGFNENQIIATGTCESGDCIPKSMPAAKPANIFSLNPSATKVYFAGGGTGSGFDGRGLYHVMDMTGLTQNGTSSGNGTTSSGGNSTTTICNFADNCTIPTSFNNWWCSMHLTDCSTNSDIKTNGLGYVLLVLLMGLMILFFMFVSRRQLEKIPAFVWVIGMVAVVGIAAGLQIIDAYFFLFSIIGVVAFGAFKMWSHYSGAKDD